MTSLQQPSTSTIQEPSEDPTLEEGDVEADEEYDEMSAIHIHATEWVESLKAVMTFLLLFLQCKSLSEAVKISGRVIGRSDRTVRE